MSDQFCCLSGSASLLGGTCGASASSFACITRHTCAGPLGTYVIPAYGIPWNSKSAGSRKHQAVLRYSYGKLSCSGFGVFPAGRGPPLPFPRRVTLALSPARQLVTLEGSAGMGTG